MAASWPSSAGRGIALPTTDLVLRTTKKCAASAPNRSPFPEKVLSGTIRFLLDWRDVCPGVQNFRELSTDEQTKVGLIYYHADQMRVVFEVYAKARELRGISLVYCVSTFAHHVRFTFKETFSATRRKSSSRMTI